MAKYRVKPPSYTFEAFKWTGDANQEDDPLWIINALKKPFNCKGSARIVTLVNLKGEKDIQLQVVNTDGIYVAYPSDYLMLTDDGEIYPISADVFEDRYEKVEE
jgi:hypothetical protein